MQQQQVKTYTVAGLYRYMLKAGVYIYLEDTPEAMTYIKEQPRQFAQLVYMAEADKEPTIKLDQVAARAKDLAAFIKLKTKEYKPNVTD